MTKLKFLFAVTLSAMSAMSAMAGFVDERNTPRVLDQPGLQMQQSTQPQSQSTGIPVAAQFNLMPPETVRSAVDRWSKQAGWTFGPEHYVVPVDIPVVGTFSMPQDFKEAIRILLDSTQLGDTPVQPCFYSNFVVRIVLRQERCDRL